MEEYSANKVLFTTVGASVLTSLIVGMAAAYLTAMTTIAVFEERIKNLEAKAVESKIERKVAAEKDVLLSERMIRVETKIDVLIERSP